MSARWTRRRFAAQSAAAMAAAVLPCREARGAAAPAAKRDFRISLVTWSLHRAIRANFFKQIDCPAIARTMFGVDAIELVDSPFESPM